MKYFIIILLIISQILGSLIFAQERIDQSKNWKDRKIPNTNTLQNSEIINRYVIGGGCIMNATDGSTHRLSTTAGQTFSENRRHDSVWLFSGFWVPADTSTPQGVITLTVPTGGKSWQVGDIKTFQWQNNEFVNNVDIELSRDGGINWEILFGNIFSHGSQDWTIELPRSDNCIIQISSVQDKRVIDTSGVFSIIPDITTGLTKEDKQPAGSSQNAYRLISVPINLNNPSPSNVLVDDLGGYNDAKWRFFDYQNGDYKEFGSTRDFVPGRSFFLIVKGGATIDADNGELVADSVVNVPLISGWNYVANPYNFDIPISSFSHNDEISRYSDNGWIDVDPSNLLKPWEGYAIWVDSAVILKIRLPKSSTIIPPISTSLSEDEWDIRIKAQCQNSIDQENYAGVRNDASERWDRYDHFKPPPIGDYVRIYFPHTDWSCRANLYNHDYRPEGNLNYQWNFKVQSTIEDKIILTFQELDKVPAIFDICILDAIQKRFQNLRENNQYDFVNLRKKQVHKYTLLVGDKTWVQQQLQNASVIPDKYALFHNFPNPFNSTTAIRYALPERQKVTLRIFNILGQEVITLMNNEFRNSGYQIEYWDGQNRFNQPVASGIYLYRLEAGRFKKIKKMTLIK